MGRRFDNIMKTAAYSWLLIPIVIFFIGFLRWYVAAACLLATGICAWLVAKDKEAFNPVEGMKFTPWRAAIIVLTAIAWVVLSGIGGFGFQNWDLNFRNAILHDLVDYSWPVYYDYTSQNIDHTMFGRTGSLVYYFAYYLPSAVFGKLFGWQAANFFLFVWSVIGVLLVIYFLCRTVKKVTVFAVAFLVFFSGLDIIGYVLMSHSLPPMTRHIEWWAQYFQYSSNTTMLFYVINQILPAWLITLLIMNQKGVKSIVFTYSLCFAFTPFSMVGLFPIVLWRCLFGTEKPVFKFKEIWRNIKNVLTVQNLLLPFVLLVVFGSFYATLSVVQAQSGPIWSFGYGVGGLVKRYLAFVVLEVLVYAAFLFRKHKKNPFFYIAVITLMLLPVYKIGENNDFVMRASVPLLMILSVYVLERLTELFKEKRRLTAAALSAVLLVGTVTPFQEMSRSVHYMLYDRENLIADQYKTFVDLENGPNIMRFYAFCYIAADPHEKPFFKYLAK